MGDRATEPLLRELVQGLAPVRRIPRLRTVVLGALALWLLMLGVQALLGGPRPLTVPGGFWSDPRFLVVLVGLVLTAGGAMATAVAGAIPGRQAAQRVGRRLALLGALLASGGGLWAVGRAELLGPALPMTSSLQCMGRASALGVVPALFLCAFLARALERRPATGAAFASLGAFALGALAVHTSCTQDEPMHLLLGHSLTPFAAALLLALPLSWWVRRASRRG